MNTQAGKSVGIALLLAAGLLAALFAMGVFSAPGAKAEVRGTPAPTAELSSNKPGAMDVKLELTFELSQPVDGTSLGADVTIDIPTTVVASGLVADNISVMQGGRNVGSVTVTGNTIRIGQPAPGGNRVERDALTTVTATGLTLAAAAVTDAGIEILQQTGPQTATVSLHPSVIAASVSLDNYAAGATGVTMTLKLTTDTDASTSAPVVITLPGGYSIAAGPTYTSGITAGQEFTVTATGNNPATSQAVTVKFAQGNQPAIEQMVYVTNDAETAVTVTDLDPRKSGAEDATLAFEFDAVVDVMGDSKIRVDLHKDFDGFSTKKVKIMQMQNNVNEPVSTAMPIKGHANSFYIAENSATGAKNVMAAGTAKVKVTITGLTNPDAVGDVRDAVTVTQGMHPAASAEINLLGFDLSSSSPGALVRITISELAENEIPPGEDITVTLSGFDLPESIAESQVIIDGGASGFYGNPSSILVSGANIVLSIPTVDGRGVRLATGVPAGGVYTITFKSGAGISNPASAGSKTIKVTDRDDAPTSLVRTIASSVSVKPTSVSRGSTVTITGSGFASGLHATVYLVNGKCVDALDSCREGDDTPNNDADDDFRLGGGLVVGGVVNVDVRTTSSQFQSNYNNMGPLDSAGKGTNRIAIVDGTGAVSSSFARLAITPVVELGTESIKQGGLLEFDLEDWYYGPRDPRVSTIHVGGVPVTELWLNGRAVKWPAGGVGVPNGEAEFIIVMPPGVRLGEQELMLTGTSKTEEGSDSAVDVYKTEIIVDPLDLSVTPTDDAGMPEVVVNQEFTIEGRGFTTESDACIVSVKLGDIVFPESTAGTKVNCAAADLRPDTAGNFSATFRLEPRFGAARLKVGEYRVEVKDSEGRIGQVDIQIPEPVVTVEPEESRRGSTVTVIGSKFPASSELAVEIAYGLPGNEKTIGAATPDSSGHWRANFTVPTTAVIGEDHVVVAAPIEEAFNHFKGKGSHRLPEQEVIVKPANGGTTVSSGGRMTVEGHNMPLFTPVRVFISNINVLGEGGVVETDGIGSFVRPNVLVPQLQPGTHTVEAIVQTQGDQPVRVRTTVEVADIVTRPTDEVFEDLIAANQLVVVWRYDNATSTWASYDPMAPAELNDLTLVSTTDIVWVEVTENVMFQGGQLYTGWNLITLE